MAISGKLAGAVGYAAGAKTVQQHGILHNPSSSRIQ